MDFSGDKVLPANPGVASRARYGAVAAALKLGSVSPRLYRKFGNWLGQHRRVNAGMRGQQGKRAMEFLAWCRRHDLVRDGDSVLEIGTGWVHFESLVLRLFYDVRATLFDVWDNRQLDALRRYAVDLRDYLLREADLDGKEESRVRETVASIVGTASFDELYRTMGLEYVVDQRGVLDRLGDGSFSLVYSNNVLEHVDRATVPRLIEGTRRVLCPGGRSLHNIDISDHIVSLAKIRDMSPKHYLRYSDRTWQRWFENRVQYINRLQRSEWLGLFERAGLQRVAEEVSSAPLQLDAVSDRFHGMDAEDLECTRLIVLHERRPPVADDPQGHVESS